MKDFTLDDLRGLMRASAGVDEAVDLDGDIADVPFTEMNYDSLAVLELAGRIERDWQIVVPDDVIMELKTPAEVLGYVNRQKVA
ncbi:acyl carrier protein [Nonomuraea sp. NPDC047897]|uniref:acyl carrier protein n=1 Tax=Nonomuraea sp. NPDC047897 TaxID=3364346 RepID=UPI0037207C47